VTDYGLRLIFSSTRVDSSLTTPNRFKLTAYALQQLDMYTASSATAISLAKELLGLKLDCSPW